MCFQTALSTTLPWLVIGLLITALVVKLSNFLCVKELVPTMVGLRRQNWNIWSKIALGATLLSSLAYYVIEVTQCHLS